MTIIQVSIVLSVRDLECFQLRRSSTGGGLNPWIRPC